jgi:hypothetical protein
MSELIAPSDDYVKQLWVYAGHRPGADVHTVDTYHILNDEQLDSGNTFACKAKRSTRTIGGIYEVWVSPDGTKARVEGATYKAMFADKERVIRWKFAHDEHEASREVAALEKSGKQLHLEVLKPLLDVYAKASFRQRVALEVLVLRYLRSGRA